MTSLTLAWRPFLDPLNLHSYWYLLLIPLALGISVAYKAVRVRSMKGYWRQVGMMTVQIVAGIVGLGALSYFLLMVVIPRLIPMEM